MTFVDFTCVTLYPGQLTRHLYAERVNVFTVLAFRRKKCCKSTKYCFLLPKKDLLLLKNIIQQNYQHEIDQKFKYTPSQSYQ